MATVTIGTWYGNEAGPSRKFRAVTQLRYTAVNDTGRYIQKRHYVEITNGADYIWVSVANVSWNNKTYAFGANGIVADSGWVNVGWVAFNKTVDLGCWAEYVGGSGTTYRSEITGKYTLPVATYTIVLDENWASGSRTTMFKPANVTIKLPATVSARTGYTFRGWSTTASGAVVYQPGANYTSNANAVLYAVWQKITYTVSYDANGGSGAPAAQKKEYGTALKLSATAPVRTGYKFLGWSKSRTGAVVYQPGANYTDNAAVVLYAIWAIQANCRVKENGSYRMGIAYIKTNGTYRTGNLRTKKDGTYRNTGV